MRLLTDYVYCTVLGRGSSSTLESLQHQNQELREVISHMRTEMEQLATSENQEQDDFKKTTCSKSKRQTVCYKKSMFYVGYTRYIEKELERLKQENKKFHDMHYSNRKPPTPPFQKGEKKSKVDPQVAQVLKAAIGMNILRLYYTNVIILAIASFQKEKATYEFDLAQLRSRVRQLESSHRTHQEQVFQV